MTLSLDLPWSERTDTFLLKLSLPSNMITALAMEKKFQLSQLSQTVEHSRLGQEELRQLSRQILSAQEADAGDTRRK